MVALLAFCCSLCFAVASAKYKGLPHGGCQTWSCQRSVVVSEKGQFSQFSQEAGVNEEKILAPFRQQVTGSTPTGWIQLGTPKKWLKVIFDTGSDKLVAKTWETIAAELFKIDQGGSKLFTPTDIIYNHDNSSSYKHQYLKNIKTGEVVERKSMITYGSGQVVTDDGKESILIGNRTLSDFTLMEIVADDLSMIHDATGTSGILGLQHMKNKSLGSSLFSEMRNADLLTAFGYCKGSGQNGTFIWGDDSTEGTKIDVIGEMHWAVKLGGLNVPKAAMLSEEEAAEGEKPGLFGDGDGDGDGAGGFDPDAMAKELADKLKEVIKKKNLLSKPINLASACPDSKCTGLLDTGSNIIAGPTAAITTIGSLVALKPDCSNFDTLPDIEMTLGGMPVKIPPSGYVMKVPAPKQQQVAAAAGGGDGASGDGDGADAGPTTFQTLAQEDETVLMRRKLSGSGGAHQQWKAMFDELHRTKGIDFRSQVDNLSKFENATSQAFICMLAFVPMDMPTSNGPLWIVGTPLLDAYYTRWSFPKGAESPQVHLKPLEQAETCKSEDTESASTPGMLHAHDVGNLMEAPARKQRQGPIERRAEEISFPHWAKNLKQL